MGVHRYRSMKASRRSVFELLAAVNVLRTYP
jgi:hypothetical protein